MSQPTRPPRSRSRRVLAALLTIAATLAVGASPVAAAKRPTSTAPPPVADTAGPIVFSAYHGGVQQVFRMNPDGTGRTQITFNKTGDKKCDPMLSPSGAEVAYAANDGGIYVNTIATNAVKNIAPAPDPGLGRGAGRRPAWSPDGNTIVFSYSTNYNEGLTPESQWIFDLWMTSRDATGSWTPAVRITKVTADASAMQPRFRTGDERWISYTYRNGDTTVASDLYVAQLTPEALLRPKNENGTIGDVLIAGARAYLSTWNADGSKIGFVKSCTGGIHVVDVVRTATGWAAVGPATAVVDSGGCGLSFSRVDANRLVYQGGSNLYVVDLRTPTPVSIGIGSQPSW